MQILAGRDGVEELLLLGAGSGAFLGWGGEVGGDWRREEGELEGVEGVVVVAAVGEVELEEDAGGFGVGGVAGGVGVGCVTVGGGGGGGWGCCWLVLHGVEGYGGVGDLDAGIGCGVEDGEGSVCMKKDLVAR